MLSNTVLQKTVYNIAGFADEDISVYNGDGTLVASVPVDATDHSDSVREFIRSSAESQTISGLQYIKVFDDGRVEYVVVSKEAGQGRLAGRMVSYTIAELSAAYRERLDKDNFLKNLLLDNLLLVDIYNRAKKLHIEARESRAVMIINLRSGREGEDITRIRDILHSKSKDFVTAVNEDSVVVIFSLEEGQTEDDLEKKAQVILAGFSEPVRSRIRISYGSIIHEIRDVSRSYKEAIMAMEVGEIFFKDRPVVAYSLLGIGRLIYQLPIPLCKMFIKETFKEKRPDDFDEEMLTTIHKFFENSLNVSETSRQLYIHRNTLVYRLDKLQKSTGLDLRVFEDAITFKIAMMVVEYMKYMEDEGGI